LAQTGRNPALERLEAQAIVPLDELLRGRLALDATEMQGRAARSDASVARATLGVLTGLELSGESLAEPHEPDLTLPSDAAIDRAPALAGARATAEAARSDARAAESERRAQLKLTADAGALGVHPERTFRDNAGGQFLLAVTVPLFDGGAIAGRIAAADAAAASAAAKVDAARQSLELALLRARATGDRARQDLATARATIPIAADQFQLVRARYLGGGNVRLLEVLDALNQYVESHLRESRALLEARSAAALQEQLLGEPGR